SDDTPSAQSLRESPSTMSAFGPEQGEDAQLEDIEEAEEEIEEVLDVPNSLRVSQSLNRSLERPMSVKVNFCFVLKTESSDRPNMGTVRRQSFQMKATTKNMMMTKMTPELMNAVNQPLRAMIVRWQTRDMTAIWMKLTQMRSTTPTEIG